MTHPLHTILASLVLAFALPEAEVQPSAAPVEAHLKQVSPLHHGPKPLLRSEGQDCAVLLIHGLGVHPISKVRVERTSYRSWQEPGSEMVQKLAPLADVFALSYTQNARVEQIPDLAALPTMIGHLRELGYAKIVLVGHSAGGLIARHFVEDFPDAGVTKVIQVCAPNSGSPWARFQAVRSNQLGFLASMTPSARKEVLTRRGEKVIPAKVEFACIVGSCKLGGDGLVACKNAWSDDLQQQGIPAFPIRCNHYDAMINSRTIDLIARLVREPLPRLEKDQVSAVRKKILE